jgi:hypothetical protein
MILKFKVINSLMSKSSHIDKTNIFTYSIKCKSIKKALF